MSVTAAGPSWQIMAVGPVATDASSRRARGRAGAGGFTVREADMAHARISQTFADGTTVTVEVGTKADYPDASTDMVNRAADLWARIVPSDEDAEGES